MMGGQITVQSKSGTGTTFAFSVPFGISQLGAAPADKAEIRTTSRRILVVEDNAVNRVVAQRMLERMGHSVDLATEGAIAIRKVEETRYDLLLMDVNMPGLDGLETTRRIRNLPPPKAAVPIIALTASAMADDRRDCVEAGMNDYLSKPINVDALRVVIDRWASGPGSAPQTLVEQLSA